MVSKASGPDSKAEAKDKSQHHPAYESETGPQNYDATLRLVSSLRCGMFSRPPRDSSYCEVQSYRSGFAFRKLSFVQQIAASRLL